MKVGLVARMEHLSDLKRRAKGKGPEARVAQMILAQMSGKKVRPL